MFKCVSKVVGIPLKIITSKYHSALIFLRITDVGKDIKRDFI